METLNYNEIAELIVITENGNLRSLAMKCVSVFEKHNVIGTFSNENTIKEAWGFAKSLKGKHPNFDSKIAKQFFINSYTNVMETSVNNESKTQKVRDMLAKGMKVADIAKELGLSYQRVVNVKNEAKLKEKKHAKREAAKAAKLEVAEV